MVFVASSTFPFDSRILPGRRKDMDELRGAEESKFENLGSSLITSEKGLDDRSKLNFALRMN